MASAAASSAARKGRKVFKKAAPNDQLMVYLGKRDFFDHGSIVDPIDGVITVDESQLKPERKVFARLVATFNYGQDDLELLGVEMHKELFCSTVQVYPPVERSHPDTNLQSKLKRKLGDKALPFLIEIPPGLPSSVTMQASTRSDSQHFGVDYELICFVGRNKDSKVHRRSSVRLNVRKLTYVRQYDSATPAKATVTKAISLGRGDVELEASLDKELYHHGQSIVTSIRINNRSKKAVKGVSLAVRQFAILRAIEGHDALNTKCTIASHSTTTGFPIPSGTDVSFTFSLTPNRADNTHQPNLALDGQIKDEDTGLASSTQLTNAGETNVGIIVSYEVKIKVQIGLGELCCHLPFSLSQAEPAALKTTAAARKPAAAPAPDSAPATPVTSPDQVTAFSTEEDDHELELVFEDFVRGRAEKFFANQVPGGIDDSSDQDET